MKRLIVLQGIPGSGKSTFARKLAAETKEQVAIVSADALFEQPDGTYVFVAAKLDEAHAQCFRRCIEALQDGTSLVIVDNTCTRVIEIAPYMLAARAYGYQARVIRIECDPEVAASRRVPDRIPEHVFRRMYDNFMRFREPSWWKVQTVVNGSPEFPSS